VFGSTDINLAFFAFGEVVKSIASASLGGDDKSMISRWELSTGDLIGEGMGGVFRLKNAWMDGLLSSAQAHNG
jgi:hypothetical protein